jgi:hypothetical protein
MSEILSDSERKIATSALRSFGFTSASIVGNSDSSETYILLPPTEMASVDERVVIAALRQGLPHRKLGMHPFDPSIPALSLF